MFRDVYAEIKEENKALHPELADYQLADAVENIDAALFTGDLCCNKNAREKLLSLVERWKKRLDEDWDFPDEEDAEEE
jgi:hypothetical protein